MRWLQHHFGTFGIEVYIQQKQTKIVAKSLLTNTPQNRECERKANPIQKPLWECSELTLIQNVLSN